MKILVTGGAGFIGSELVRQLTAGDHHAVVLDNLINGKKENLAGVPSARLSWIVEDLRNSQAVESALDQAEVVFHLACLGVRHSIHSPRENHEVNATATLNLLELSRKAGVKRFVCVSTSEVYGTARAVPMTEEHPTFPHTVYGASKLAGECYARAFYQTYGFPTVVVRPFNSFGPRSHHEGDSGEVIPKFILKAMCGKPLVVFGDGCQTRDFTYVSDTAAGIIGASGLHAIKSGAGQGVELNGQTFNIGTGQEITINELASEVISLVKRRHENRLGVTSSIVHQAPRPGDVRRLFADVDRAKKSFSFSANVSLANGLERLLDWYMASGKSPLELLDSEVLVNWEAKKPHG